MKSLSSCHKWLDIAHKVSRRIVDNAVSNKAGAIVFEHLKKLKPKIQAGLSWVPVVIVDPLHTSQRCPRCSHTEKRNRVSILFSCQHCSYTNNADRIGGIKRAANVVSGQEKLLVHQTETKPTL